MDCTSLPTDEAMIVEQMPVSAMTEDEDSEVVSPPLSQPSEDLIIEEEIEEELIIEDFTIDGICGVY